MLKMASVRLILSALFLSMLLCSIYGQESGSASGSTGSSMPTYDFTKEGYGEVFIENYPLGPGDALKIRVFTLDPFEENVQISLDGKLILPTLGELDIAGKTIPELRTLLTEKYREFYSDFTISVELTSVKKIQVYVFGKTTQAGIYTVYANTTLLDFLQQLGMASNGQNRNLIHYRGDEKTLIDPFRLFVYGEIEEQNKYLQFGDRIEITIPVKSILLSGKVLRQGVFEVLPGENLRDILTLAGGPDPFGDLANAVIDRPRDDGTFERIHVDLMEYWHGDKEFDLQDRDRIFVPSKDFDIFILGAVGTPGRYPFVEGKAVEQYLADAGGFFNDAHLAFVTVIRPGSKYGNDVAQKFNVNLKEILKEKFTSKHDQAVFSQPRVILEPGDIIMVPYNGNENQNRNLGTILNILQNVIQSVLIFR
jgi:protein involved in polysaccharide export with SLBB domain